MGFRIDPVERLNGLFKELGSLHTIYTEQPNFGVHYDPLDARKRQAAAAKEAAQATQFKVEEYQELNEGHEREINTKLNSYLAAGSLAGTEHATTDPIYCKELGFAMERIPEGYKLQDLWNVMPTKMVTLDE